MPTTAPVTVTQGDPAPANANVWHYTTEGMPVRIDCACYAGPLPRCGYPGHCTCHRMPGMKYYTTQRGWTPAQAAAHIYVNAPCKGHSMEHPITTDPAMFGKPCRTSKATLTGPRPNADRIAALEAANPDRAAKLRAMGLRRSSPWYMERLAHED